MKSRLPYPGKALKLQEQQHHQHYQCVRCFRLSKPWYGCPCLGFLTRAQMLMRAIAYGGLYGHRKGVCTESCLWEKTPLLHWGLEPLSVLHHSFSVWCSTNWAIPPSPSPHPHRELHCVCIPDWGQGLRIHWVVVSLKYTLLLWGCILEAVLAKGSCGCTCVCLDLFRTQSLNLCAICALVAWNCRDLTCVQYTLMWHAIPEVSNVFNRQFGEVPAAHLLPPLFLLFKLKFV